jgi:uncharacterized oligopeptide transporter (OPT) family protein
MATNANSTNGDNQTRPKSFLPRIDSPGYHLLLAGVAIFILGPLGGISAAYMNFSLGFFVGGQVLAGILGSVVTYGYGAEGKHGANYMQTMAASVASMSGMAVLVQAMVWLGIPEPPTWQLVLFFMCVGMFGVGIGMLYTPILVDKMQLTYPSGFAVANILRALTDKTLLKRSIAKLGSGTFLGFAGGLASAKVATLEAISLSTSTFGAGMVVGARIVIPALVVGLVGWQMTPWFRSIGWLGPNDPFRKIGFILSLGTILGAAIIDLSLIGYQALQRLRGGALQQAPVEEWKRTSTTRLIAWVVVWGAGLIVVATQILHQPMLFVGTGVVLVFIFVLINGISNGISDSNPISSAFVVAVFLMALLGLKDPGVGLMCAAILLISCAVGVDMQQDRSTGWRLGTNRTIQFRYQVIGIIMGAILTVVLAKVFMKSYPVLRVDTFTNPDTPGAAQWQSAMTYKFVGALKGLTNHKPYVMKALFIGISLGFVIELLRKIIKSLASYKQFARNSTKGRVSDFILDAFILPSPYASSFGGFVNLQTTLWFAGGGILASLFEHFSKKKQESGPAEGEVPGDMSTTSLVGGGLIAGDSLAALSIGLYGLLKQVL